MTVPDGGYAFPLLAPQEHMVDPGWERHGGMSLRDYFAGQALAGIMASPGFVNVEHFTGSKTVKISYAVADLMLNQRAKGGEA